VVTSNEQGPRKFQFYWEAVYKRSSVWSRRRHKFGSNMVNRKAWKYSNTTINCQSNTCQRINQKFRWGGVPRNGVRGKAFIKICDIRDSKQDSLAERVSISLGEDKHIFHKSKDWSTRTLNSPYKVQGIPYEQEKEEGWCVLYFIQATLKESRRRANKR